MPNNARRACATAPADQLTARPVSDALAALMVAAYAENLFHTWLANPKDAAVMSARQSANQDKA